MAKIPLQRPGLVVHLDTIRYSEIDDDGFPSFQIDADGDTVDGAPELEPGVAPFEGLHAYGFWGMPLDPTTDGGGRVSGGAHSLTLWEGDHAFVVPHHDSRLIAQQARLKKGESAQYGPANNFVRCHADGRISQMCTSDGTENGSLVACEVGPNGFAWRGAWGKLTHDKYGLHYLHTSGARLDLGAISGLPAPLDQLGAYATLKAPIVNIEGAAVKIGVGTFEPAAKALALLTALAAQSAAASAQANANTLTAAALAALAAIPLNAAAAPACGAAVTALGAATSAQAAAVAAIGAAATTVPAVAVSVA